MAEMSEGYVVLVCYWDGWSEIGGEFDSREEAVRFCQKEARAWKTSRGQMEFAAYRRTYRAVAGEVD